jgi:hypothetical protein
LIDCLLNSIICWIKFILLRFFLFFINVLLLSVGLYIAHAIHSRMKFRFCVYKWRLICLHERVHIKIWIIRLLHCRLWWGWCILREWHHKGWLRKTEWEARKRKINRHWGLINEISWLRRHHHLRLLLANILCRFFRCWFFSLLKRGLSEALLRLNKL